VDAFYNWLKLRLPDPVVLSLATQPLYQPLFALVFSELENSSDENIENATNCVIELISLSRKKA
jgi:hypothetical protein